MVIEYTISYLFFVFASMRAAKTVNKVLVESILGSTLR